MSILRIYDPAECDEQGVPLDWERCRTCAGAGDVDGPSHGHELLGCATCGGHGSLREAARDGRRLHRCDCMASTDIHARGCPAKEWRYRCEGCGHPMSEGTWEDDVVAGVWVRSDASLLASLQAQHDLLVRTNRGVHYSPCDEGCRHDDVLRVWDHDGSEHWEHGWTPATLLSHDEVEHVEALWRPVDVRALGWAHDLRPEKHAVLCLRCYAERTQ